MTATQSAPTASPAPATSSVDWRLVTSRGVLAGAMVVFIVAIGMLETFNRRLLIAPILSLGYAGIGWVPPAFGYQVAKKEQLEGLAPQKAGIADIVAGLITGTIAGLILWLFTVLIDAVNLREVFVKLSPALVELLTFGRGLGFAFLALVGGSALLGALGGALAVFPERVRRGIFGAVLWVFVAAILEAIVEDIFDELGLSFITDFLYELNGGLTVAGAIAVAIVAGFLSWRFAGATQRYRTRMLDMPPAERRSYGFAAGMIGLAVVILLPIILGSLVNELLANVGLFLLMALGLNIVVGYAGLLDLGYVAFFAVGAYTTAVLTSPISPRFSPELTLDFFSWEGLVVVLAVMLVAGIAGLVVGTPVIRMRGDYLAIVTLGFGEIVRLLFLSDWLAPTFGGAQGIRQIPGAEVGPLDTVISGPEPQAVFYLVAIFVVLAIYVSWRLSRSRIGRAWAALREDELVAEAMGIDTVKAKLLAFVTGALLASFGGMVFAVKVGSVFPSSFELLVSILVLVVVIVGGMGSIPGVVVGAVVLVGILGGPTQPGVLQEFQEFKLLIYGALLVYMMLNRPEGLIPSVRRSRELHHEELAQDAWLSSAIDAEEEAATAPPAAGQSGADVASRVETLPPSDEGAGE
jgi:branched-chain amino acid transport system permease protein